MYATPLLLRLAWKVTESSLSGGEQDQKHLPIRKSTILHETKASSKLGIINEKQP
jgi:hypothetical protein